MVKRFLKFGVMFLLASLGGCAASDSAMTAGSVDSSPTGCVGPSCGTAGADAKGSYDISLPGSSQTGGSGGATSTSTSEIVNLCGVAAVGCNPDDEVACKHAVPVAIPGPGGASSAGTSLGGGTGAAMESSGGAGGGTSSASTSIGGRAYGGASSTGEGAGATGVASDEPNLACNVVLDASTTRSQCEVAGKLGDGESCTGRGSCAAGFACADDDGDGVGQCRHYCCAGDSVCPTNYYCAKRESIQGMGSTVKASVSVCLPSVACKFDDPYPCPAGDVCSCPTGKVCGLVRSDGMTDCVVPGSGVEGQACPCAAGHVCSTALGTCVRICSLVDSATNAVTCPTGACQASASLPDGVGVCVSSSALN